MKTILKTSLFKKAIFLFPTIILVFLVHSCEKQEEEESIETFKSLAGPGGGIVIRRKYKWKITQDGGNCETGKGLCISGPIGEDKKDDFNSGYLAKNGEDGVIIYFNNNLVNENDLISNDSILIDSNISINDEFLKIMNFDKKEIIKGKYKIEKSDTKFDFSAKLKIR